MAREKRDFYDKDSNCTGISYLKGAYGFASKTWVFTNCRGTLYNLFTTTHDFAL